MPSEDSCASIADALALVGQDQNVPLAELQSQSRRRAISNARRVAILCCRRLLGIPLHVVAGQLGISPEAARQLEKSATDDHNQAAARIAKLLAATNRP